MLRQFLILTILVAVSQASTAAPQIEMRLWEGVAPGSEAADVVTETTEDRGTAENPDRRITGVTVPTITVYRPATEANSGAAVVICPGGAYSYLTIDKEGHEIARYLESIGVTAAVLKYRLPRPEGFTFNHDIPLQDAARAIRLLRHHASDWNLRQDRIGIMGFSAGGHLASTIATHFDGGDPEATDPIARQSSRPDFQAPIYPVVSFQDDIGHGGSRRNLLGEHPTAEIVNGYSNELQVSNRTPPAFVVSTFDDGVKAENSLRYFKALRTAAVPAELHIYEVGGHGYGIRPTGKPVATWHHRFAEWMTQRGLLDE